MGPSEVNLINVAIIIIKGEKEKKRKAERSMSNILFIIKNKALKKTENIAYKINLKK